MKKGIKSNYKTAVSAKKDSDPAKNHDHVVDEGTIFPVMYKEVEDQIISLLHLENLSGLRHLKKHQSLDYKILEEYIYSDIIPEETPNPNRSNESKMEDDSQHAR
jgi:hypothetical protein